MMFRLLSILVAVIAPSVLAIPVLQERAVPRVSPAEIASYNTFAFYASAAYCRAPRVLAWDCGVNCQGNPQFQPLASGGNGNNIQQWFVGYDPILRKVLVSIQGTESSNLLPILTDLNFFFDTLDDHLFPGVSKSVKVHNGFTNSHAEIAPDILAAVQSALTLHSATEVVVTGHSLGAGLAILEAVQLSFLLSPSVTISVVGFGTPRVGNQAFANLVDARLAGRVTRVNNKDDLFPLLPPRTLGFRHSSGEKRVLDNGEWADCPGQDNTDKECSFGDVKTFLAGSFNDHLGPYLGVDIMSLDCPM